MNLNPIQKWLYDKSDLFVTSVTKINLKITKLEKWINDIWIYI